MRWNLCLLTLLLASLPEAASGFSGKEIKKSTIGWSNSSFYPHSEYPLNLSEFLTFCQQRYSTALTDGENRAKDFLQADCRPGLTGIFQTYYVSPMYPTTTDEAVALCGSPSTPTPSCCNGYLQLRFKCSDSPQDVFEIEFSVDAQGVNDSDCLGNVMAQPGTQALEDKMIAHIDRYCSSRNAARIWYEHGSTFAWEDEPYLCPTEHEARVSVKVKTICY